MKFLNNRVTVVDIEDQIEHEFYMNVGDAIETALSNSTMTKLSSTAVPEGLFCMTKCVLVMKNGFVVTGSSACADPANYDQQLGERYARKDAIKQLWPLLGFMLKDQLHEACLEEQAIQVEMGFISGAGQDEYECYDFPETGDQASFAPAKIYNTTKPASCLICGSDTGDCD